MLKWFLIVFIIVGITNAVNLTDGLDGLVAGSSAVSFGAILIIAFWIFRHPDYYSNFMSQNIDTLFDDRDCSIGKKLSDNDLIGTPFQIVIGKRDISQGLVEVKDRLLDTSEKIKIEDVKRVVLQKLNS